MGDHDRSYRLLFQHPEMIEDLLRGFIHESWIDDLDFDSLEHLADIHVTGKLQQRETDMVWKLRYKDKEWLYVYILLEFQSTVDPFMALRLLVYVGLLAQRLKKQGDLVRGTHLPPILPLVLYNGERDHPRPAPTARAGHEKGERGPDPGGAESHATRENPPHLGRDARRKG